MLAPDVLFVSSFAERRRSNATSSETSDDTDETDLPEWTGFIERRYNESSRSYARHWRF